MIMLTVANLHFGLTGINRLNAFDELMSWTLSREAMLHIPQLWFVLCGLWDEKVELTSLVEKIKITFANRFPRLQKIWLHCRPFETLFAPKKKSYF